MPDWKAPFRLPEMNNGDFAEAKAKYIAKYGYTVTYPTIEDFIKIDISKPITLQEQSWWKNKQFDNFTPERKREIEVFKRRRKEQYLKMLGSPTPAIFNARSSIIGALDDAQDAISTLAAIGRLAVRHLAPAIATLVSGPVGWLMKTASLLDVATSVLTPEAPKRKTKRALDELTSLNPKTRKVKWKRAADLAKQGFTGGDILQAAQTTDQVFGIGISLGAFMAFPIDFLSGVVRGTAGSTVEFKVLPIDIPFWHVVAKKALKAICCMLTAPSKEFLPTLDETILTAHLASQIDAAFAERYNMIDSGLSPNIVEVEAPRIMNLVTREAIEETGNNPDEGISWPSTGQQWSTYTNISNSGRLEVTKNFNTWCEERKHDFGAFLASCNAVQSSHYLGECVSGKDSTEYDFTAANKFIHELARADYAFPHYYNIAQWKPENLITDESISAASGIPQKPKFPQWVRPHGNIQDQLEDPIFQQKNFSYLIDIAKNLGFGQNSESQARIWLYDFVHPQSDFSHIWNHLNNLGKYLESLEEAQIKPDVGSLVKTSKDLFGFPLVYSPIATENNNFSLIQGEL